MAKKTNVVGKWKSSFVIDAYELAREGFTDNHIAKTLGVSDVTLSQWKNKKPLLREAIDRARALVGGAKSYTASSSLRDYIYNSLPSDLKRLWKKINRLESAKNGVERIDAILNKRGVEARQHLFLYAWTSTNFSTSQALRKVNISYKTFQKWCQDPDFVRMVNEITWHKKNFFESHLIALVAGGDSYATIFANKTFNKDRGYGDKQEIEITGKLEHQHTIQIDQLDLPMPVRKMILNAMRKTKEIESRVLTGATA